MYAAFILCFLFTDVCGILYKWQIAPSDADDVLLSISLEDLEEEMCSEAESGYWTVVNLSLDMDFWAFEWRVFLVRQAIVDSGWSSVNFHIIFILISTSFGDNNNFFDLEIETWVLKFQKIKPWPKTLYLPSSN